MSEKTFCDYPGCGKEIEKGSTDDYGMGIDFYCKGEESEEPIILDFCKKHQVVARKAVKNLFNLCK